MMDWWWRSKGMARQITRSDIYRATLKFKFCDVPALPNNFQELKDRIHVAVESIDSDTLHKAWE
jgi:hypothetical protein